MIKHIDKVTKESMDRLREAARIDTVNDEHGKMLYAGHPMPGQIEDELRRTYKLAVKRERRRNW